MAYWVVAKKTARKLQKSVRFWAAFPEPKGPTAAPPASTDWNMMIACAAGDWATDLRKHEMKRSLQHIAASACLAASPLIVAAQEEPATEPFNVESISCWDVATLPEDDAIFVTAMLIGYANGKSGQAETSAQAIVTAVEMLDSTCADNPDMPALEALSK